MSEYTPDTGAVRAAYVRAMRQAFIASTSEHADEFDRWLAAHDREVREQIEREVRADGALYPGDDGHNFAEIFARVARGEDKK